MTRHSHSHSHGHLPDGHHHRTSNIGVAFWLNIGFALLEIVGGLYTNSVAVLTDALHDLGDSLSLGFAWYFEKKSGQKRDNQFTYGYKRFSLLGAFINAVILIAGSIFIISEAIERLADPEQPNAQGMIVFALIGIAVNGAAMLRLKKGNSINERVVSLHFLEDVLGWLAVLIGSIIMLFWHIPILDPILSLGIALFILVNVFGNMKSALQIVLQAVPEDISPEEIKAHLKEFDEIGNVHDVHLWSMDGHYNIITMHVAVKENLSLEELEKLKFSIKKELKSHHIQHATIEFELAGFSCESCDY